MCKNLAKGVLTSQDFLITLYVPLLEDNYIPSQKQIGILLGMVILSFHKFIEFPDII